MSLEETPLLSWHAATKTTTQQAIKFLIAHPLLGITICRPDGSTIKVFYYQRPHRFRVCRLKVNGKWGSSKYHNAEEGGWFKCLNHRLPIEMRI